MKKIQNSYNPGSYSKYITEFNPCQVYNPEITFEVPLPGPELLKLIYMQATARPLTAVIESPQAEMDLILTTVNVKTGEVVKASSEVNDVKD